VIEHQLQRFDKWVIGIDVDKKYPPPRETYTKFSPRTAQENSSYVYVENSNVKYIHKKIKSIRPRTVFLYS